ncbi:MAG: hypothetical protein HY965_05725 [Ignavibacteriales bacterium]|nr:hypothetical protein [Ignavibacteriales bacterium]
MAKNHYNKQKSLRGDGKPITALRLTLLTLLIFFFFPQNLLHAKDDSLLIRISSIK